MEIASDRPPSLFDVMEGCVWTTIPCILLCLPFVIMRLRVFLLFTFSSLGTHSFSSIVLSQLIIKLDIRLSIKVLVVTFIISDSSFM